MINYIKDIIIVLSGVSAIASIIYWVIKAKLKDDFCDKAECVKKHAKLDTDLHIYRSGITEDIKEIKDMVKEIRGWVFDFMSKHF